MISHMYRKFLGPKHDYDGDKMAVPSPALHLHKLKSSRTVSWSQISRNLDFHARSIEFCSARNEEKTEKKKYFALLYFLLLLFLQMNGISGSMDLPSELPNSGTEYTCGAYQRHQPRTRSFWSIFYGAKETRQTRGEGTHSSGRGQCHEYRDSVCDLIYWWKPGP